MFKFYHPIFFFRGLEECPHSFGHRFSGHGLELDEDPRPDGDLEGVRSKTNPRTCEDRFEYFLSTFCYSKD